MQTAVEDHEVSRSKRTNQSPRRSTSGVEHNRMNKGPPQSGEAEGRTAPPHAQGSGHHGHPQIGNHIPSVGQLWKSNSLEG
ncbi:unnamed protein product [Boreogadus saida]